MYNPRLGRFMQRDPGPGGPMRVGSAGPASGGQFLHRDPLDSATAARYRPERSGYAALGQMNVEVGDADIGEIVEALAVQAPSRFTQTHLAPGAAGIHTQDSQTPHLRGQYKDGMSLYQYARSSPISRTDSTGLDSSDWQECANTCAKSKQEEKGERKKCPEGSFDLIGGYIRDYGEGIVKAVTKRYCVWCAGGCEKPEEKCKGTTRTLTLGDTTIYIPSCACK